MKKHLLATLSFLFMLTLAYSQDKDREIKTLFGKDRSHGGYGALQGGYAEINGIEGVRMGARAAWVAGHSLAIGIAGNGFMSNFRQININEQSNLAGGYGGVFFEPILFPRAPVHLAFPLFAGAGGVAYTVTSEDAFRNNWTSYVEDMDMFLIAEPGAEIEFNVTRFFRLALGASYRFTSPLKLEKALTFGDEVSSDALKGLSLNICFKIGKF